MRFWDWSGTCNMFVTEVLCHQVKGVFGLANLISLWAYLILEKQFKVVGLWVKTALVRTSQVRMNQNIYKIVYGMYLMSN